MKRSSAKKELLASKPQDFPVIPKKRACHCFSSNSNEEEDVDQKIQDYTSEDLQAETKQNKLKFECFPNEIKDNILKFLDIESKKMARLVNSTFRELIDRHLEFNVLLSDDTFDFVQNVNGDKPIKELAVQDCSKKITFTSRSRSYFAKKFVQNLKLLPTEGITKYLDRSFCSMCGSDFHEDDVVWVPGVGTSGENLITLLRLLPNIEGLILGPMSLEHVTTVENLGRLATTRLELLSCIELQFGDDFDENLIADCSPVAPYQQFLKNTFPSLKTFKYSCKAYNKPIGLLLAVYTFLGRHWKTLKILHIDSEKKYIHPEPLTCVSTLLSAKRYEALIQALSQIQLTELFLRVVSLVPPQSSQIRTLEYEFLKSQQFLEKVEIVYVDEDMFSQPMRFLPSCFSTLKSLTILCGHPYTMYEDIFDCSWVKDFKNLEVLRLEMDHNEWGAGFHRVPGLINNFQYLPSSLKELQLGGTLTIPELNTIFCQLKDLKTFSCNGLGNCVDNVSLFHNVLDSTCISKFRLLNEKCFEVLKVAYQEQCDERKGLIVVEHWGCVDFIIDRSD